VRLALIILHLERVFRVLNELSQNSISHRMDSPNIQFASSNLEMASLNVYQKNKKREGLQITNLHPQITQK
jgi:hypothetical protein